MDHDHRLNSSNNTPTVQWTRIPSPHNYVKHFIEQRVSQSPPKQNCGPTTTYYSSEEMGTNHGGGEGIEVAGTIEHGSARSCLSFHEHLRKTQCQRRNPAPPMPMEDATWWARRARSLVTSSLEAGFDGWREERGRSPPSAPRRRASPARRETATAAAARRGMVARIVGFFGLWSGRWSGPSK